MRILLPFKIQSNNSQSDVTPFIFITNMTFSMLAFAAFCLNIYMRMCILISIQFKMLYISNMNDNKNAIRIIETSFSCS